MIGCVLLNCKGHLPPSSLKYLSGFSLHITKPDELNYVYRPNYRVFDVKTFGIGKK